MKVRIAHLSDPHFGANFPQTVESLKKCILTLNPDLILLSGDITQRARSSQFAAAAEFVESLRQFRWAVVPGNHDIPLLNVFGRFLNPYGRYKNYFSEIIEKELDLECVQVFTLNSTSRFRHVQGALSKHQIEKIVPRPFKSAGVRIACYHHPMDCPKRVDEKNLLKNRDEVMRTLANAEVDIVVGGHIHDPYITLSSERYPEVNRKSIICVAGTCLSWRTRSGAPNSFNVMDVETSSNDQPTVIISRYDLQSNNEFVPVNVQRYLRDRNQGWTKI